MLFDDCGEFEVGIINKGKKVDNIDDYVHIALKYV